MLSEEIYESCSIFKHCDEEERAEALENYLRPRCSTPRSLEENVLHILWRWKLEDDDIQASPPRRGIGPLHDTSMKAHARQSPTPNSSSESFARSVERGRSSWDAPCMQSKIECIGTFTKHKVWVHAAATKTPSAITYIKTGPSHKLSFEDRQHSSTKLQCVGNSNDKRGQQHRGANRLAEPCPPHFASSWFPSSTGLYYSLRGTPVPFYFAYSAEAPLFSLGGNVRHTRVLPAYSDYSRTKPRGKLTVREARLRARDIETRNLDIVQQSETLSY